MTFGATLRMLRKKKGLTQGDLAKIIGVSDSSIGMYETDQRIPSYDIQDAIADFFNVDLDFLFGRKSYFGNITKIPVYGQIAAGIPLLAVEDIEDYEEIDEATARNGEHIALRIHGDSMEPRICDGDVIIIRKQPTCEDGDVCAVCVNGDYATCKKVRFVADGIMLVSLNTAYEPQFYSKKQCEDLPITIIGRVVELRGKV